MTTLRQAAQAVLERWDSPSWSWSEKSPTADLMAALRTALAQPEQEPVAWMSSDRAWMWSDYSKAMAAVANIPTLTLIPLYTTPPQRPWQGLTEEEIWSVVSRIGTADSDVNPYITIKDARAIEKLLKDRNG